MMTGGEGANGAGRFDAAGVEEFGVACEAGVEDTDANAFAAETGLVGGGDASGFEAVGGERERLVDGARLRCLQVGDIGAGGEFGDAGRREGGVEDVIERMEDRAAECGDGGLELGDGLEGCAAHFDIDIDGGGEAAFGTGRVGPESGIDFGGGAEGE